MAGEGTKVGAIYYDLDMNTAPFEAGAAAAKTQAASFTSGLSNMMKGIEQAGKDLLPLSLASGAFIAESIKWAEQEQKAEAELQQAIDLNTSIRNKNTGALIDQAGALEKVTEFSREDYVQADANLAIHKLTQDQIMALVPHIADMAEGIAIATGSQADLGTTTQLVSKALGEGDIEGFSGALRRAGVFLTDQQKQILKTGDMQQKLAVLTDVLSGHFDGFAKVAGDTTAGKLKELQHNLEDTGRGLGDILLPKVNDLVKKLNELIGEFDKLSPRAKAISANLLLIAAVAAPILLAVGAISKVFQGLWAIISGGFTIIRLLVTGFLIAAGAVASFFGIAVGFGALLVAGFIVALGYLITHWNQFWSDMASAARRSAGLLINVVQGLLDLMTGHFRAAQGHFAQAGADLIGAHASGMRSQGGNVNNSAHGIANSAQGSLNSHGGAFRSSGSGLMQAFASGISSASGWVQGALNNVLAAAKRLLPHSDAKEGPLSTLTASGSAMMETFAKGIGQGAGHVQQATHAALSGLLPGATSGSVPGVQFANVTINGNVGFQNQSDIDYFFKKMGRDLELAKMGMTTVRR